MRISAGILFRPIILEEKRKYDSDCIALKGELTGLEEKVTHHNSVLALLEKKVKGFHNCLNALKQEIDIYFVQRQRIFRWKKRKER